VSPESANPSRTPALVWTGVFAIALAVKHAFHEPWRDEYQAWAIARASGSLPDLVHNIRYEGHPFLWHAVLWPVARLTGDPRGMQAVAWVIAVATAWLVLRHAPFPMPLRVALVFSYYPFFEYGVIARSYGLGMLLVVAACVLLADRERHPVLLPVALGALSLTSVYGLILSGALTSAWVVAVLVDERRAAALVTRARVLGVGGVAVCMAVAVRQIVGVAASGSGEAAGTTVTLPGGTDALTNVWNAFVPIPGRLDEHYWSSNISRNFPLGGPIALLAGVFTLGLIAVAVHRTLPALWLWVVGAGVFEASAVIRFNAGPRHSGTLVLLALAAFWLGNTAAHPRHPTAAAAPDRSRAPAEGPWSMLRARAAALASGAIAASVALSVVAAALATYGDVRYLFSSSRRVAGDIRDAHLASAFIMGYPDSRVVGVAAELDRELWFPNGSRFGTYTMWDVGRTRLLPRGLDGAVQDVRRRHSGPIVVITGEPVTIGGARLLASYPGTTTEELWVYVVPPATAG
jgi:hypothetical protein